MDVVDEMLSSDGLRALRRRREKIVTLTQRCYEAVTTPRNPGGITSPERVALACRMARATGIESTIRFYDALAEKTLADAPLRKVAMGEPVADPRLAALAAHVDLVTRQPGEANQEAIDRLRQVGLSDADIVALAELVAVVNYQIRVVAGLELLGEVAA